MAASLSISLAPEVIATWHGIPITNSLLASGISSVLVLIIFIMAGQTARFKPSGRIAFAVETLIETAIDFVNSITGDETVSRQLFPFVMTFFVYILFNNWLGLLPGISAITTTTSSGAVPLLRSGTADLNTTVALAIISVITTQIYGIRQLGIISHLKKYISLNPMHLFVGLLEAASEMTRLISFSFRLFGSVFAGEVLLLVIGYFLPLVGPLPFLLLEVLFGLVQAVVFAMLTLVFMKLAMSEPASHQAHATSGGVETSH